ncbi:prolipoprotein diacylglyceryl transferase [Hydrogenovibrio kuenenii]|uniref:prolipoprotein diacylglyceryl transferase n=1 Tax=Hydrogenovibrio kuenenii TaxID=63658 RepID=UPI00046499E8|nr:prolipoprotein diacylglyceryl transferase [Hydrogenovibrio kuenenii]
MWTYPSIDPIALSLGPIQIHWYGLMYLAGFLCFWLYGSYQARNDKNWNKDLVSDFLFYGALGVILGGRIGYILFYDLPHYIDHPADMLKLWMGGMSFHGGLIGVTIAMLWFARYKMKVSVFVVADFVAPLVPFGLFFGRIGNFINGELWGKVVDTHSMFAMKVFDPTLNQVVAKYPTQLLEAFLEGIVLFTALAFYRRGNRPVGAVSGMFLVLYGTFRFFVEFFRMPDPQLGYLMWGWVTMGQILSLPMILIGLAMIAWAYRKQTKSV